MTKIHYVALLRGINVGGNNIIRMADLKACLVKTGFEEVATFIQSGNVMFASAQTNKVDLGQELSAALEKAFGYKAPAVLKSFQEMKEIVHLAPRGFGSEPANYKYDVLFLKEPLSSTEALKRIAIREGVDTATAGPGVLYFSRLTSQLTKSRMRNIITSPIYQSMTIRNWNTTTKLLSLLEERSS